jgi:uncharacterized repeat protein (TIGR02543 family)
MQKQLKRVTALLLVFLMAASVITELPAGWGGQAYASSSDIINTVAGTGTAGYSGDGLAATSAQLNYPKGVAVDSSGNLYIADQLNHRIRKVATDGTISTVAGTGTAGYSGDSGVATSAQLNTPLGVAVDSSGNLYIADNSNNRIRKVAAIDGKISTVAGTGAYGYSGDGGAATSAQLKSPNGVAVDSNFNLYIADYQNNRIRKVTAADGTISTVAGTGTAGYSGDGGAATSAQLQYPQGVAVDSNFNLYIGDSTNNRIRKVAAIDSTISTVAGTGTAGYSGDGLAATSAMLNSPIGVTVDSSGNLYIADYMNVRIRKVAMDGTISTVAGTGSAGYSGDGIAATSAKLQYATGVALDSNGNLYIADFFNHRIRKVGKAYIVTFNSNSGSAVISQPVNYDGTGKATQPADPTRAGYSFGGWYADSGLMTPFTFTTVITGDTTLYAKWTAVPVTGVTLDAGTLTLTAGGSTATLAATVLPSNAMNKNVTWTSNNTSVATVNSSGVVTPAAAGTATITVTTADGSYQATSVVTVNAPAQTVSATAATPTPAVGADDEITLTVEDALGNPDTTFTGAHDVTISGYEKAPDNTYGSFNGTVLTASTSTIGVTFASGVATANLKLNKAGVQTINMSVTGVTTPAANMLSITPVAGMPMVTTTAATSVVLASASTGGNVTSDGGDPVTERGVVYSTSSNPTLGSGSTKVIATGTTESTGSFSVNLSGLSTNTLYHYRAYATNSAGTSYGDDSQFSTDVKYGSVGPSIINGNDKRELTLVGEGFNMNSPTDLTLSLIGKDSSSYPISAADIHYKSGKKLTLSLPSDLPVGSYDLSIKHASFDSKTFTTAVTLTNEYDKITVNNPQYNPNNKDQVEKIFLEGPFVKPQQDVEVYTLSNTKEVVSINGNLLFKGTSLTIDKTDPTKETIAGNGRLYVGVEKSKKTTKEEAIFTEVTIHKGEFKFDASNFEFKMTDLGTDLAQKADFLRLNVPKLPIEIKSFIFIPKGIRLQGTMDVAFNSGSATVTGEGDVKALDIKGKKVDLAGQFEVNSEFKNGPFEKASVLFGIDTIMKKYRIAGEVDLRKTNVGIEVDFTILNKKLDAIKLVIHTDVKIPDTGVQFTSFGGQVENLANKKPLEYTALTSLSDYVSDEYKINGKNLVNVDDIRLKLYQTRIAGTGEMNLYGRIHVADIALLLVTNPKGIKGFNGRGFRVKGEVDYYGLGVLVGDMTVKVMQPEGKKKLDMDGSAKFKVKIPNNVKFIGGKTLAEENVSFNKERLKAGLSVAHVPFTLEQKFKSKDIDFKPDMDAVAKELKKIAKKVADKIKKAAKKAGKTIKGWFSVNSLKGKDRVMILSASPTSNQIEVIGGKLFDQMDMKPTARGKVIPGYATTLVTETNPVVTVESAKVTHSIQISSTYPGVVMLNNASADTQIFQPNGEKVELRYEAAGSKAANAVYNVDSQTLVAEVDFNQVGTWKFISNDTMGLEIHKLMFRNPNVSIGELVNKLSSAAYTSFIPLDFNENGMKLIEIQNAKVDRVLIKPDGQVYASETDAANPAWNTFEEAGSDKVNIVAEVAQTGTWLVDAGEDALVSLYDVKPNVPMSKLEAWKEAPEMATPIDFSGSKGEQVWTEISHATPDTKLFKSDGTAYKLVLDPNDPNWNAKYDEVTEIMSVLIEVDVEGTWMVKSNDFVDISMFVYDSPVSMAELNDSQAEFTSFLDMNEKGSFLFDIAGGSETTQIIAPDGQAVSIITDETNPAYNATLNKEDHSLKVAVDVNQTGEWQIVSIGPVSVNQYKLAPMPVVDQFQASKGSGLNQYELNWHVINPKQDTKVRVVLTDNPDEPSGESIAIDLPASGVRTISLPEGYLPGNYYLALIADSESFGPIFKVLDQPIQITGLRKLSQPQDVSVVSTGDGVIELAFKDANWQDVTAYRVLTADESGNVNYNGASMDVIPANQEQQKVIVANLEPGASYNLSVIAFNETEASVLVSDPSAIVKADLPVPVPAKLTAELDVSGAAKVDHLYMPEDTAGLTAEQQEALQEKITVSSASQVAVNIASDQNASIELFVNGVSVGVKEATTGTPASFSLENLSERDYTLVAKAVNARGDRSSYEQMLYIDQTAPYLSVSNAVYGQIVDGSRFKLTGTSEPGVRLTINNALVPVDQYGSFAYVVQFPDNGVLPLSIVAQDELGHKTEQQIEIVQGEAGEPGEHADLAALTMDEGDLSSSFESNVVDYSVEMDASTKEVLVSAVPVEPDAVVTINGIPTDEDYTAMIQLPSESSKITVLVQAADHSSKMYTLGLKLTSSLAALSNVTMNWDEVTDAASKPQLSPSFSSLKDAYRVVVANNVTHTSLIPTSAVAGSLITVNGTNTLDGQTSDTIPLIVGDNTITVQVLSLDESNKLAEERDPTLAKMYTITVTRKASSVAELKSLSLEEAALTPGVFDTAVDYYQTTVAPDVNTVTLHTEVVDTASVVNVNDTRVDTSSGIPLHLVQGKNTFSVSVIAANGVTKTYTIDVLRQTAVTTALNLKSLSIEGDELNKEFSPWQLNYKIRTGSSNSSTLKIKAVPVDPAMLVSVNGVQVNELGSASIQLHAGENTVLIKVETPDGLESKTYAIRTAYTADSDTGGNNSDSTTPALPATPTTQNTPNNEAQVLVNGKAENAGTATTTKVNEQTVTTVAVDPKKLEDKLAAEGQHAVITISVNTKSDVVIGELDGQMVKNMEQKQAVVEIKTEKATYTLPAQQINISALSDQFGTSVQLQDIKVMIEISKPTADTVKIVENSAAKGEFTIVAPPLNFTVKAKYGDTTIDVSKFNAYVERTIAIPDGVDTSKITTGVVVDPDGTVRHVPTKIVVIDGKHFAKVNSLTNSTYAIVWHPLEFKDAQQHWAKDAVNDMGSRMVISGIGNDMFNPDQDITRAEFAAIMVRGLGLKLENGSSSFADVKTTDWYNSVIQTAYAYKLISGFEDGNFHPMDKITREQAMTIIAKAMKITGLGTSLGANAADELLSPFADASNAAEWAKNSIADCLQAGIVAGRSGTELAPRAYISRAEVAAIVQRLLQKSELINTQD